MTVPPSLSQQETVSLIDGERMASVTTLALPDQSETARMMEQFLASRKEMHIAIPRDKYEPRRTAHNPIFVIHETAMSGRGVLSIVTKPAYRASFHVLILRDGTIVYMVPPDKAAYTAGYSQFNGEYDIAPSGRRTVNYFAYQVELESPTDGYWATREGRRSDHSGYSKPQYMALAWLAKRTGVPRSRITTHAYVDLSNTRTDPRSFDWNIFWEYYNAIEIPENSEAKISILPTLSASAEKEDK